MASLLHMFHPNLLQCASFRQEHRWGHSAYEANPAGGGRDCEGSGCCWICRSRNSNLQRYISGGKRSNMLSFPKHGFVLIMIFTRMRLQLIVATLSLVQRSHPWSGSLPQRLNKTFFPQSFSWQSFILCSLNPYTYIPFIKFPHLPHQRKCQNNWGTPTRSTIVLNLFVAKRAHLCTWCPGTRISSLWGESCFLSEKSPACAGVI